MAWTENEELKRLRPVANAAVRFRKTQLHAAKCRRPGSSENLSDAVKAENRARREFYSFIDAYLRVEETENAARSAKEG